MDQKIQYPFPVCYEIGSKALEAPRFFVSLVVDPEHLRVIGQGVVIVPTTPPGNVIPAQLQGSYQFIVFGNQTRIALTATGFPPALLPIQGILPLLFPNVELQMVVEGDWGSGSASYRYRVDPQSPWIDVTDQTAQRVECPGPK